MSKECLNIVKSFERKYAVKSYCYSNILQLIYHNKVIKMRINIFIPSE